MSGRAITEARGRNSASHRSRNLLLRQQALTPAESWLLREAHPQRHPHDFTYCAPALPPALYRLDAQGKPAHGVHGIGQIVTVAQRYRWLELGIPADAACK